MSEDTHDVLYQKAVDAVSNLFSDKSVCQSQTKDSLNSLIGEIEIMMDTLPVED